MKTKGKLNDRIIRACERIIKMAKTEGCEDRQITGCVKFWLILFERNFPENENKVKAERN